MVMYTKLIGWGPKSYTNTDLGLKACRLHKSKLTVSKISKNQLPNGIY